MSINIERFFADQIREQRKASSGAFHKKGKGVKNGMRGALLTPYYYMKNKERKKLNGEVSVFKMYETILNKQEFLQKDVNLQKLMLTRWREIYDNHTIRMELGMTNKDFYDLVNKLEIPKKNRVESMNKAREGKAKVKATKKVEKELIPIAPVVETPPANTNYTQVEEKPNMNYLQVEEKIAPPEVKPLLISRGLHLEYNGEYTSEQIVKIFNKLMVLTEGEENKFNLAISLSERT